MELAKIPTHGLDAEVDPWCAAEVLQALEHRRLFAGMKP